jgi:hypothetical protein
MIISDSSTLMSSLSINDNSRSVIDYSRAMLQIVVSQLSLMIIYDSKVFIVQGTEYLNQAKHRPSIIFTGKINVFGSGWHGNDVSFPPSAIIFPS